MVAAHAQRDEICFIVFAGAAPELDMMHLQVFHAAAALTPPVIPFKHLCAELPIVVLSQPNAGMPWSDAFHEADSLTRSRKSCCCDWGKNLNTLATDCTRASGFPFSRFAPARKSAQIISKQ